MERFFQEGYNNLEDAIVKIPVVNQWVVSVNAAGIFSGRYSFRIKDLCLSGLDILFGRP